MKTWLFIPVLSLLLFSGCNKWTVPPEYSGKWVASKTKITVRTEPKTMKFQFTSDSATISILINNDKTVTGYIGSAAIVAGRLKKNRGLPPSVTGVVYIIECGSIGKIFKNDPLENKEVEIWLSPIKGNESMKAELRYTENMAVFPMAGMRFVKLKE